MLSQSKSSGQPKLTKLSAPQSPTLSDSALLDSLDDSELFNIERQRERRLEEFQAEVKRVKSLQNEASGGYGEMQTFGEEKTLVERISWVNHPYTRPFTFPFTYDCQTPSLDLDE